MKNLVVLFVAFALFACGDAEKPVKEAAETSEAKTEVKAITETTVTLTDAQMKNADVATGKLEYKNISTILKVSGTVDVPPQNLVSVSVPLGGYLKTTHLIPGMYVSKGQRLALMEDPQYIQLQQDYLTAQAKLVYAQQEYSRQKELNLSKASSDKVLQQSQTELSSQTILLRSLAEKLRLININPSRLSAGSITRTIGIPSPISGYVSKVNVNIGKYVNPADVLFEIVNPSAIHLVMKVFEKDVSKLRIGQTVLAYTNAVPSKKYVCKITLIDQDLSEDRAVEVHSEFTVFDKALLPGTFMNAEIETQNNNVYAVPSDAIITYENKQYVFVEKGRNQFEQTEVMTGATQDNFTEISPASIKALGDQKIVVKGAYSLLMKMKNTSDEE